MQKPELAVELTPPFYKPSIWIIDKWKRKLPKKLSSSTTISENSMQTDTQYALCEPRIELIYIETTPCKFHYIMNILSMTESHLRSLLSKLLNHRTNYTT